MPDTPTPGPPLPEHPELREIALAIDPEAIAYTPLAELEGVGAKAIRDAGAIPVAEL